MLCHSSFFWVSTTQKCQIHYLILALPQFIFLGKHYARRRHRGRSLALPQFIFLGKHYSGRVLDAPQVALPQFIFLGKHYRQVGADGRKTALPQFIFLGKHYQDRMVTSPTVLCHSSFFWVSTTTTVSPGLTDMLCHSSFFWVSTTVCHSTKSLPCFATVHFFG